MTTDEAESKKLESMRTFGEEFRKLMQQDAADYTEKAIENLQRQLAAAREGLKVAEERTAIAIEALKNAMKALKHAQEKALKDAEERTAIAIKALKDAQEKDAAEYMTIAIKALNDTQEQVAATANPEALPPKPMPPMPPIGLRTEVELRSIYIPLVGHADNDPMPPRASNRNPKDRGRGGVHQVYVEKADRD